MKIFICALSLLLIIPSVAFPVSYTAIANGMWSDSSIWLSNSVPSYFTSDTILIRDSVRFENDLYLFSGGLLMIDSGGGLCGHRTINSFSGSLVSNAGILEIDSFMISGGRFENIGFGRIRFAKIMKASMGGTISFMDSSSGCGCAWDTCFGPETQKTDTIQNSPVPIELTCDAKIFPSVGKGNFILEYQQFADGKFYMYNSIGQLVFNASVSGSEGKEIFQKEIFAPGIYLWQLKNEDTVCGSGKLIVTK